MRFAYTADQERLRTEAQAYFGQLMGEEGRQSVQGPDSLATQRRLVKRMADDGWLGLAWPREYGGQERDLVEQFIFHDEAAIAGAPYPVNGVNLIGPTLIDLGTEEQRARFLPGIRSGVDFYCVGYSEPAAGTDLASVQTRARLEDGVFTIDGVKTWTSYASIATHCWLAARTDVSQARHSGLSVIIVPMDAPGVSKAPLKLLNDHDASTLTFDSVRVPVENMIGDLHGGWSVITRQLNYERVTMGAPGLFESLFRDVRTWAASAKCADGSSLVDLDWVRSNLAQAYCAVNLMRLMSWSNVDDARAGRTRLENVSATKIFGTETGLTALNLLLEVLGNAGPLSTGDEAAVLSGRVDSLYRHYLHMTFGGGASEIQREIIAGSRYGIRRTR